MQNEAEGKVMYQVLQWSHSPERVVHPHLRAPIRTGFLPSMKPLSSEGGTSSGCGCSTSPTCSFNEATLRRGWYMTIDLTSMPGPQDLQWSHPPERVVHDGEGVHRPG